MSRDDDLLEAVRLLHDLEYSDDTIAQKLHIEAVDVSAILSTGEVPQRQRLIWETVR